MYIRERPAAPLVNHPYAEAAAAPPEPPVQRPSLRSAVDSILRQSRQRTSPSQPSTRSAPVSHSPAMHPPSKKPKTAVQQVPQEVHEEEGNKELYVIEEGRENGYTVYWGRCKEATIGYPRNSYKGFKRRKDGIAYAHARGVPFDLDLVPVATRNSYAPLAYNDDDDDDIDHSDSVGLNNNTDTLEIDDNEDTDAYMEDSKPSEVAHTEDSTHGVDSALPAADIVEVAASPFAASATTQTVTTQAVIDDVAVSPFATAATTRAASTQAASNNVGVNHASVSALAAVGHRPSRSRNRPSHNSKRAIGIFFLIVGLII